MLAGLEGLHPGRGKTFPVRVIGWFLNWYLIDGTNVEESRRFAVGLSNAVRLMVLIYALIFGSAWAAKLFWLGS